MKSGYESEWREGRRRQVGMSRAMGSGYFVCFILKKKATWWSMEVEVETRLSRLCAIQDPTFPQYIPRIQLSNPLSYLPEKCPPNTM